MKAVLWLAFFGSIIMTAIPFFTEREDKISNRGILLIHSENVYQAAMCYRMRATLDPVGRWYRGEDAYK